MRFVEKHPERGTPYTPIAFLLDPAHGWEMTDYPQWPFGLAQLDRSDRALRELFAVAYYPGSVVEGEPASADRQAFVAGIFGDIFDVLVASDAEKPNAVERTAGRAPAAAAVKKSPSPASELPENAYRGIVAGGHIEWSPDWAKRLKDYVTRGGTVVLNPTQIKGLSTELLGVRLTGTTGEAHNAQCAAPNEEPQDLHGQIFRYEQIELKGAEVLMSTTSGSPLVTINRVGKGSIIFCAVADLLGEDDRIAPFAAHMLAHVFTDVTPLQVRGDVEYLVNRTSQSWIVTLFNNNGVLKPQQGLAQVDRSANVTVSLSLRGQGIAGAQEWLSDRPVEVKQPAGTSDAVTVNIAPGGVAIVELRPR
jgi:hypothetical protein